jgi:hypothetical protein
MLDGYFSDFSHVVSFPQPLSEESEDELVVAAVLSRVEIGESSWMAVSRLSGVGVGFS